MGIEIILSLLAGIISLVFGGLLDKIVKPLLPLINKSYNKNPNSKTSKFLSLIFEIETSANSSYSDRIQQSLQNLKTASAEIDRMMADFSSISEERQRTVLSLENKLQELTEKEANLTKKIQTLEKVPIEAVRHFEEILSKGDKKSAYRDYFLFGLGVIVSVIATISLKLFGL